MCLGIITALAGICSAKAARNQSISSAISPEQTAAHPIQAGGVGWGRRGVAKEELAAACAHALRGGGGGGGGGGSLHRYFHRAAQLEEEQKEREHRAAVFECGRHSYVREVLGPGARLERDASLVLATRWLARNRICIRAAQASPRICEITTCSDKKTPGGAGTLTPAPLISAAHATAAVPISSAA